MSEIPEPRYVKHLEHERAASLAMSCMSEACNLASCLEPEMSSKEIYNYVDEWYKGAGLKFLRVAPGGAGDHPQPAYDDEADQAADVKAARYMSRLAERARVAEQLEAEVSGNGAGPPGPQEHAPQPEIHVHVADDAENDMSAADRMEERFFQGAILVTILSPVSPRILRYRP